MRLARFSKDGGAHYGVIDGAFIYPVDREAFFGGMPLGDEGVPLSEVRLLAPCEPTKIVALGLNYRAHAEEFNLTIPEEPLIFLKPPSSVIGPGGEIVYPSHMSRRVDYEGELAVVIGKTASRVAPEEAEEYILGYTCFNDVTARDLQKKDGQWSRAKGFDTFSAMGPWIETDMDPGDAAIETILNGETRQRGTTADMIFSVPEIVSFVSKVMTLLPGDVIATGTPPGVGKMKPGDRVDVRVGGIGTLSNTVVSGNF